MSEQIRADFFCASLPDNIFTLKQSIPVINKFYENPRISIICPDKALKQFVDELEQYKNVRFIPESELISFDAFQNFVNFYANQANIDKNEIHRINWYYQQALKISFALQNALNGRPTVMLDADTILLKKINFFLNNRSKLYGSLTEYNYPYFQTLEKIFNKLPRNFLAFTAQFFSCTPLEAKFLENLLKTYLPKSDQLICSEWISIIIIKSVMDRHRAFKPALFSEQELFGLSNKLFSGGDQAKIYFLRFGLNGPLNKAQYKFIRMIGFEHLTYEPVQKFTNKQQGWLSLIAHALRELWRQRSGKIVRKEKRKIARSSK